MVMVLAVISTMMNRSRKWNVNWQYLVMLMRGHLKTNCYTFLIIWVSVFIEVSV